MLAVHIDVAPRRTSLAVDERSASLVRKSRPDKSRRAFEIPLRWQAGAVASARENALNADGKDSGERPGALMQLIAAAREDLNRVYNVVHLAGYAVVVCDGEGAFIYHHDPRKIGEGRSASPAGEGQHLLEVNRAAISATAIFEEDDRPVAFLGVAPSLDSAGESPAPIVGAVLRAAARGIEERRFRTRHRSEWIIAGVHHGEGRSDLLLAVDRQGHIIGADRGARQLLSREGCDCPSRVSLWSVFERHPLLHNLPHADDVACALVCRRTSKKWWVLVTPPVPTARCDGLDSASTQTRPRLDAVGPWDDAALPQRARGGLAPGALRRVREHIDNHLSNHIDADMLASTAGLSSCHFSRAFKQSVGMAPHAYVISRRLQRACTLLAETDLCLAEVALACGFADQSHFTRVFSRELRSTPGAWRRARQPAGAHLGI